MLLSEPPTNSSIYELESVSVPRIVPYTGEEMKLDGPFASCRNVGQLTETAFESTNAKTADKE